MLNWYALHVHSNCERTVARSLSLIGVESFTPERAAPRVAVSLIDAPRRQRPLFPGYVFARFDLAKRTPVVAIPQVSRILGMGSAPVAIDDAEIESVRILANSPVEVIEHPFLASGTAVRVKYGPLLGAEGIVAYHAKGARIVVSITLMGRAICAEVDDSQLEAIPEAA